MQCWATAKAPRWLEPCRTTTATPWEMQQVRQRRQRPCAGAGGGARTGAVAAGKYTLCQRTLVQRLSVRIGSLIKMPRIAAGVANLAIATRLSLRFAPCLTTICGIFVSLQRTPARHRHCPTGASRLRTTAPLPRVRRRQARVISVCVFKSSKSRQVLKVCSISQIGVTLVW